MTNHFKENVINKIIRNQMKNTKYPTVRTISKSNIKTVERGIIDTPNTKTHENSISWLGTGTQIRNGAV